jgi:5-formyltetrahydrofolate cyclo-ligase
MAGSSLAAIRLAKADLRKRMKQSLLAMTSQEKSRQSSLLCKMFLSSEEYQKSQRVAIYLSMHDEIDTEEIMQDLFKTNR